VLKLHLIQQVSGNASHMHHVFSRHSWCTGELCAPLALCLLHCCVTHAAQAEQCDRILFVRAGSLFVAQVDEQGCSLVVTTGGTGPAKRDITPEATQAVCSKMMPGFGEQMRAISLKHVPTAILSRQTAGIRGQALVMNLPGKPKSIREILDEIFSAVPYCMDIIGGPYIETRESVVKAFRPPKDRRAAGQKRP
jgi:Probable molybdopterin binding domain